MDYSEKVIISDLEFLSKWNAECRLFAPSYDGRSVAQLLTDGEPFVPSHLIGIFAMCIYDRIAMYEDTPRCKKMLLDLFKKIIPRIRDEHAKALESGSYVWAHVLGFVQDNLKYKPYKQTSLPFIREYISLMRDYVSEIQPGAQFTNKKRATRLDLALKRPTHSEHLTMQ